MKNTITVNAADGTRENYNIAVSFMEGNSH